MKIYDMISICFRNLWRRKGRTLLTIIGVVIGSCAVIVMISLGLGMNQAMDNMLASWGDLTAVTIYNGGGMYYESNASASTEKPKLDDAALATLGSIEHVSYMIPKMQVDGSMVTVVSGKNDRYRLSFANIMGVDFSIFDKLGYVAADGEMPNENNKTTALVFGAEIPYQFMDTKKHGNAAYTHKQQLPDGSFSKPFIDPVGDVVKLCINNTKKQSDDGTPLYGGKGYEYKMTGVAYLEEDNQWETPYCMFIDINIAKQIIASYNKLNSVKKAGDPEYSQVKIIVDDLNNVDYVQKQVEELGFSAQSMAQIRNEMMGSLGVIEMVLGGLAAISLLVAAISITNTMIMSIYERTREIGIMKVLGCFIANIRLIFLMEAGMIGLLGGIVGTVISYIISAVMNSLGGSGALSQMFGVYSSDGGSVSIIPIWLVLLALAFSTVIGLISGFYPANRAVRISALEAIKNE